MRFVLVRRTARTSGPAIASALRLGLALPGYVIKAL